MKRGAHHNGTKPPIGASNLPPQSLSCDPKVSRFCQVISVRFPHSRGHESTPSSRSMHACRALRREAWARRAVDGTDRRQHSARAVHEFRVARPVHPPMRCWLSLPRSLASSRSPTRSIIGTILAGATRCRAPPIATASANMPRRAATAECTRRRSWLMASFTSLAATRTPSNRRCRPPPNGSPMSACPSACMVTATR